MITLRCHEYRYAEEDNAYDSMPIQYSDVVSEQEQ